MCIYDIYGPCSFPHGTCYTLLAQCFALGSFVFSTLALTSCFYVSVRPIPVEGEIELPKEGFGWLTRQIKVAEPPSYGKQCVYYSPEERETYFAGDAMWNSGYAMAFISVTLGVITMCVLFTTCCIAYKMPTFDGLFWTCIICFIAQALTFLSWGSDLCQGETEMPMECTWSSGTGMNLTAAMMWVWAANMIKSFPEALPPRKRKQRSQEENDGYDDDDGGAGDVYMPNRNNNNDEDDEYYDEYNQGDGDGDGDDEGYYDEDGNWIENQYNDEYNDGYGDEQPDGYDNYDGEYDDTDNTNGGGGYSDYDNEDSSNDWAEGGGNTKYDNDEDDDDEQQQKREDDSNSGRQDDDDDDDDDEDSSQSQQQKTTTSIQ